MVALNPFNSLNSWSYQPPLREPLKAAAAVRQNIQPCHFHDVGKRLGLPPAVGVHERHALVAYRAHGRHRLPRCHRIQIADDVHAHVRLRHLESPANRGTAIMQGAKFQMDFQSRMGC